MIKNKKVYPPFISYCAKVIPLAFDESLSYYECICNIANHINNEIIPVVNENSDIVNENKKEFEELKQYVDDNMITKDINDLTYYTLTSNLSAVATSGNYNDLNNKPTIPTVPTNVSAFNNDSGYITKSVNDLTNYTLTSNLSTVATSGDYGDLLNKPTIPTVPTNVSAFNNDSGYITKSVDDLTNYTTSTALTTLLSGKENATTSGSNANGSYLKFDNGILIQWNRLDVDDQAISSAYGSLYQGTRTITFPIAFVSNSPICQCSEFQWGTGASWGCVGGVTLTTMICRGIDIQSRPTGGTCHISWIAIGRWK